MNKAHAMKLDRVTAFALSLPEAERRSSGDHVCFSVRGKKFAYFLDSHHGDGILGLCVKAPPGDNAALIASDPMRFYMPAYIGPRGWVGLRLDTEQVEWQEVQELIIDSYSAIAPKRLAAMVGQAGLTQRPASSRL